MTRPTVAERDKLAEQILLLENRLEVEEAENKQLRDELAAVRRSLDEANQAGASSAKLVAHYLEESNQRWAVIQALSKALAR